MSADMTRARDPSRRVWPTGAMVLYPIGLLAALAVALLLGGDHTGPARWALIVVPLTLVAAASLVVRRAQRSGR
jgi:hypothetical protein